MPLSHVVFHYVVVLISVCIFSGSVNGGTSEGRLDIYFIDVEGGAATFIVTPLRESLLIDSGYPDFNGRDRNRIIDVVHRVVGLKAIDHAAVTHWHSDHYGNHAALSTKIPIRNFWDRGIPDVLREDGQFVDRISNYRAASQNESKILKPGDFIPFKKGRTTLSMKIVTASRKVIKNSGAPNPYAKLHKPKPVDQSDNSASLSFLLEYGSFKFLCCGDLTWNIEAKLVTPNNPIGKIDLFMVTHHGLPSSNNPALVLAVDPKVAIMCNGPTKGGHPSVISTLNKVKSLEHWYQLHRNHNLAADKQAPAEFILNQHKTNDCPGGFIKVSVASDGASYTVQLGEKGRIREYQTR